MQHKYGELQIHQDMCDWLDQFPEWEEIILYDGFEDAFVGIMTAYGSEDRAVYDYDKCIQILVDRDEMNLCEAQEYFSFNVLGMYVGDRTPAFINLAPSLDWKWKGSS